MTLNDLELQK